MTKLYLTILLSSFITISFSQTESAILDANNARATINHDGIFFRDNESGIPGYEIPKGSGNHAIFSMSFWFGGVDVSGALKLSAQRYEGNTDLFPGALSIDGTTESVAPGSPYGIFSVKKSDIDNHIENHDEPGYIAPSSIENWPAHGDLGQAYYLAPFVDVDGDGDYIPSNGDYPKIRGDEAAFLILNDKQDIHAESGGDPIGLEIHLMFYQYQSVGDVDNTTFLNMKVINRGTQTLFDFYVGCYMDSDVGFASDDYVGFDSTNSVMYTYNADLLDEGGSGGQPGYGGDIPAIGMALLNRPVDYFMAVNSGGGPFGDPETAGNYYNFLRGIGGDGEVMGDYMYDGNPNNPEEWSELSEENPPGDRRMLMSTLVPDSFAPNQVLCFDYAVVFGDGTGDAIENVNALLEATANIREMYNDEIPNCTDEFLNVESNEKEDPIKIYPNPSNGTFTVDLTGDFDLEIFSVDGRLITTLNNTVGQKPIETGLTSGTYILVFNQNQTTYRSTLVVE